ncbi:MAG: alpha-galactosidase, partial [Luteolibacter sp.]
MRKDRFLSLTTAAAIATCGVIAQSHAADPRDLPPAPQRGLASDWLLDSSAFKAGVFRTDHPHELVLENGLVRRTFRLSPNAATVGLDHQVTGHAVIRAVRPEAEVTLDGTTYPVGGLVGQPNHAFLLPEWLETMQTDPAAFQFTGFEVGETRERFAWKRVRHHAPDAAWPPKGVHLQMHYRMPGRQDRQSATQPVHLTVHYELYDGVPVFCKWLTLRNGGDTTITVDRFSSEILAVAEEDSPVETRAGVARPLPQALHVETDFAFGGFNHAHANRHVVHWRPDPQYTSIVNYTRDQPTLLVVSPDRGPAQDIAPGGTFESHRTFQLVHDSTCRTRRGLALKRMYRTIAPWTTENPLMHHLLDSRPEAVRQAIDHAAEVGFETIILSFGSGFNIENDDPAFLGTWKGVADHARSKGIDLGSYSLLSSRPVGGGNDVVSPPGEKPTHGTCPALTSEWGREYFRKLYRFHRHTGFSVFEHDGSYPGDVDVTPRPPLQK